MRGADLISAAMRSAGLVASGETPSSEEAADAQTILNQMLEAWSAEKLSVFTLNRNTFSFVASTAAYTVGSGGTFNMARPAKIEYVTVISNANPSQPLELPALKMYSDEEWAAVTTKSILNPIPQGVYDDGGFPFRTLTYWPIPSDSSYQTVIGSWAALTQFTDLTTDNTFPPGYIDAIKYNLAVRLAADFDKTLNPAIALFAQQGLARIKTLNVPPIEVKMDSALASTGGHYDWRTDSYR